MPPTVTITEQAIKDHITRAVSEVFTTMLGQQPRLVEDRDQTFDQSWLPATTAADGVHLPYVVGTVGFIGEANGLIYLYLPEVFARMATGRLLGLEGHELDAAGAEEVNDAIGEVTNMTVGVFKNCLCDAGYACRLTIPSILRGSNFHVEPVSSALRRIFSFDCSGHQVVADIMMKIGE